MMDKNLESIVSEIKENKMVLLTGSTKACGVCTAVAPRLKELAGRYDLVKEIYVDIAELKELAGQYMIFTVPTTILFVEGKEVHRESRIIDFNNLEFEIERWSSHLKEIPFS